MIILTAGHTGPNTGAQCAETHFDEGAENIWLRNRIAEILTNKYGLAVLLDNDTASLQLLIQSINALPCRDARLERPMTRKGQNPTSTASPQSVQICRATLAQQESESLNPNGKKSFQSVQSVGENSNPDGTRSVNSVSSVSSVREKENSVSSVSSVRDKNNSVSDKENSVRNNNSEEVKSVQICRATLAQQESESLNPDGKKSFQSVLSVGENSNPDGTRSVNQRSLSLWRKNSVHSVSSVRDKNNSVREKESSVRNNNSEGVKSVQIQRALLTKSNSESLNPDGKKSFQSVQSVGDEKSRSEKKSVSSVSSVRNKNSSVRDKNNSVREKNSSVRSDDFVIDLHFNAHTNPNARGTETIVSDDATTLELRFATRLAHATADALDIPLRSIKSESETPHHRLAMLHLTPQSIILEVCFCTSPEDVEAYRKNREKLAADLAWAIAELILDKET